MLPDADTSASLIFNQLGRKAKIALSHRDAHAMREHVGVHPDGLDHAVGAALLAACDKYAGSLHRKGAI